jgi:thiol-disulfide isomerase/thioredoxin
MNIGKRVTDATNAILFSAYLLYGIAILLGAFLVYKFLVKPRLEHFSNETVFRMFKMEGCPHCVAAKPEFDKILSTKEINGKPIEVSVVDSKDDLTTKFGVTSFPTFILTKDGKNINYDGERTSNAFLEFLKKNV